MPFVKNSQVKSLGIVKIVEKPDETKIDTAKTEQPKQVSSDKAN